MLNEKKNNNLSVKNSDELPQNDAAVSTESNIKLDDGQAPTRSTYESFFWFFAYTQMFARRLFKDLLFSLVGYLYTGQIVPNHIVNLISVQKSLRAEREAQTVTYTSEDDFGLQCSSNKGFEFKDREPMFVIVDSSCISNPSSLELLIDNTVKKGSVLKKHVNKNVIPIGIPSTSRDLGENIIQPQLHTSESVDELQMIEINLQSENEIPIENDEIDNASIVISYLQNKELHLEMEGTLISSKKKSSLLEDVPKMETILEGKQFSSFPLQASISQQPPEAKPKEDSE